MDRSLRIKADGDKVLLIRNGVLLDAIPWEKAIELADALKSVARVAESNSQPVIKQQVDDQAVLLRSGFMPGLSLTPNTKVFQEAWKEAQWGDIRRYIKRTPLIPSDVKWGLPNVKKMAPVNEH